MSRGLYTPPNGSQESSLFISDFQEVRWLQGQSLPVETHYMQKMISGVTKDTTAIAFIKEAWQSMSHAWTASECP